MYLPRRRKPVTRAPVRRFCRPRARASADRGDARWRARSMRPSRRCLEATHHGLDFGEFRHGGAARYRWRAMSDNPGSTETTDFGFSRVPRAAKGGMVRAVFDSVAPRYDLMNDLMSLGVHRAWKDVLVTALEPASAAHAAGSGGWHRRCRAGVAGEGRRAGAAERRQCVDAGCGARSGVVARVARRWSLLVADAERLPLPDRAVDRVSIAFGLRNCTDKAAVLAEARRVLKPGGRFFCLEFSRVQVAALQPLYDAWSFRVLPALGRWVARDEASYRYLAESIRTFPGSGCAG